MSATQAAKNRAIRQAALREELSNKGLLNHVFDCERKLREQAGTLEKSEIASLKAAADINLKLINKYLPDTKEVAIEGNMEANLTHSLVQVEYVSSNESSDS